MALRRALLGGGASRVWVLNAVIAAAAIGSYLAWSADLPPVDAPRHIPWWGLAPLFLAAEVCVVHIELRRGAHSFSLSEIPLVLGLLFSTPGELMLGQLAGSAAGLVVVRRQSPIKLLFNLAQFALSTGVAVGVFHAVGGPADPVGPGGWGAAAAAAVAAGLLSALAITSAIALTEGVPPPRTIARTTLFGVATAITTTSLALVGAGLWWRDPTSAWLLAVPTALLFAAYRAYASERRKHASIDSLYRAARTLQRSLQIGETMRGLLEQARGMFRAEIGELDLLPEGAIPASRAALGPGARYDVAETELDPTQGVWARVVSEEEAVLLPRPIHNERLREHFAGRGIRDLMVVPMRAGDRVVGVLRVANRLGDVSTFSEEDLKLFETMASHASIALQNARLVERLEDSLARLKQVNRMKDDFIATVSHELRTPLTIVQGFLSTMLRKDRRFTERERWTFLEAAQRGANRLHDLIEEILLAGRIDSGHIEVVRAPTSLRLVAERVLEDLEPRRDGHVIELRVPEGLPAVQTDGEKLHRILTNLVENALKYSRPGRVTIAGEVSDGDLRLSVSDEGPGIPPEHRERVFERFHQVDSSTTRVVGGTGLGLYICRGLAKELGGRLWLARTGEGGSEFRLELPLGTPPKSSRVVEVRAAG